MTTISINNNRKDYVINPTVGFLPRVGLEKIILVKNGKIIESIDPLISALMKFYEIE